MFGLVIGADGLNSITNKTIVPDIKPMPPMNFAAYRAVIPMEMVKCTCRPRDPMVEKPTMDIWMGAAQGKEYGYVTTCPISGESVFNLVFDTLQAISSDEC